MRIQAHITGGKRQVNCPMTHWDLGFPGGASESSVSHDSTLALVVHWVLISGRTRSEIPDFFTFLSGIPDDLILSLFFTESERTGPPDGGRPLLPSGVLGEHAAGVR